MPPEALEVAAQLLFGAAAIEVPAQEVGIERREDEVGGGFGWDGFHLSARGGFREVERDRVALPRVRRVIETRKFSPFEGRGFGEQRGVFGGEVEDRVEQELEPRDERCAQR